MRRSLPPRTRCYAKCSKPDLPPIAPPRRLGLETVLLHQLPLDHFKIGPAVCRTLSGNPAAT